MAAFHFGHTRPDAIARQPTPHEHDEAVQPRDAVAAVGERLDVELELLILGDGRRHAGEPSGAAVRSGAAGGRDAGALPLYISGATTTRRSRGPSNSQKKIPCHVPSASRPDSRGTSTCGPINPARTWDGAFSSPSSMCCHPHPSSTRRSSARSKSRATAGSACSLIVTPAVVWGTKTSAAEAPSAAVSVSWTRSVMSTSWVLRSVRTRISGTGSECAAGSRGRRRLGPGADLRAREGLLREQDVRLGRPLDEPEQVAHAGDLLALLLEEPVQELLADELALVAREPCQLGDLRGDLPLLLERERDGRDRIGEVGAGSGDAGHRHVLAGVEEVLDDHHGVVSLLERLAVEARRQLGQRLGVVVDRDGDVLLRGSELAADLLVQRVGEAAHGRQSTARVALYVHPCCIC